MISNLALKQRSILNAVRTFSVQNFRHAERSVLSKANQPSGQTEKYFYGEFRKKNSKNTKLPECRQTLPLFISKKSAPKISLSRCAVSKLLSVATVRARPRFSLKSDTPGLRRRKRLKRGAILQKIRNRCVTARLYLIENFDPEKLKLSIDTKV